MASKIFMGGMPEIMEEIFNNLENELHSLYSCALVNRHWCKMSIPILWQDPFSYDLKPSIIFKYFSYLNDDDKLMLKDYRINSEFSKTLFNYARFLKVLDLFLLEKIAKKWLEPLFAEPISSDDPLIYYISNLLLKLFIENGASLHKLHFAYTKIRSEIFYSLGRNVQFFSQLQNLSLGIVSDCNGFIEDDAIGLLKILAKNSTKIKVLKINDFYTQYDPQVYHAFVRIINSQEQLMRFTLACCGEYPDHFHGIISALTSQKQSLRELIIEGCICNDEFEMLMNCKNLEILRIRYCEYEKLLTLPDYKISTLEIVDSPIDASKIAIILEKSGTLLQRLKLDSEDEMILEQSLLIKTLKTFCSNITYLNISNIEISLQFLDLIGNLQKLQFLIVCEWCAISIIPEGDQVQKFAKALPLTLQYLDIRYSCFDLYIDIFLGNCYAPLKKLIIERIDNEKQVEALIEFCIRKKTLNYVGVDICLDNKFEKNVGGYVTVVPYGRIVVNC